MKNKKIIIIVFFIAGILTHYLIKYAVYEINEKRCYNLPITEFFKDSKCEKYVEDLKNE